LFWGGGGGGKKEGLKKPRGQEGEDQNNSSNIFQKAGREKRVKKKCSLGQGGKIRSKREGEEFVGFKFDGGREGDDLKKDLKRPGLKGRQRGITTDPEKHAVIKKGVEDLNYALELTACESLPAGRPWGGKVLRSHGSNPGGNLTAGKAWQPGLVTLSTAVSRRPKAKKEKGLQFRDR